jgi:hypothetical protein
MRAAGSNVGNWQRTPDVQVPLQTIAVSRPRARCAQPTWAARGCGEHPGHGERHEPMQIVQPVDGNAVELVLDGQWPAAGMGVFRQRELHSPALTTRIPLSRSDVPTWSAGRSCRPRDGGFWGRPGSAGRAAMAGAGWPFRAAARGRCGLAWPLWGSTRPRPRSVNRSANISSPNRPSLSRRRNTYCRSSHLKNFREHGDLTAGASACSRGYSAVGRAHSTSETSLG